MSFLSRFLASRDAESALLAPWETRDSLENPTVPLSQAELAHYVEGAPSATGVHVTELRALQNTAAYACIRLIDSAIASVPVHVYERLDRGRRKADEHPSDWLLREQPNAYMTSVAWRELMQTHLLTRGNAYSLIERDKAGRLLGLWPVAPERMMIDTSSGDLVYRAQVQGDMIPCLPGEVVHLRNFSVDGIRGLSPIQMARQALGLAIAAEEYGGRFFGNGSAPMGVLQSAKSLDDEAFKRLSESWRNAHEGLRNAHRIAILEDGVEFKALSISNRDSQFLETRKYQIAEIARIYGVPPHLIGDTDKSTSWGTGIEQQSIGFVQYVLMPWVRRWESELASKLYVGSERGRFFPRFDLNGLLRADMAAQGQAWALGRQWGWLSANDVREQLEMRPIDGGDAYLSPLNMVDATKPASGAAAQEGDEGEA